MFKFRIVLLRKEDFHAATIFQARSPDMLQELCAELRRTDIFNHLFFDTDVDRELDGRYFPKISEKLQADRTKLLECRLIGVEILQRLRVESLMINFFEL